MMFRQLFDAETFTYSYLLADGGGEAVLIDPVLERVDRDVQLISELGLRLKYTLDTHVHADHVTASGVLRDRLGSAAVASAVAGPACADNPVNDGDMIQFGAHKLRVLATPGHTDGCISYVDDVHGRVFTGDSLLIRGCGRTDFQQGDARKLYASIQKLFQLPDSTLVYPGHDYRGFTVSQVGEEKVNNPRIAGKSVDEFAQLMTQLHLEKPKQIERAVPANMACGNL